VFYLFFYHLRDIITGKGFHKPNMCIVLLFFETKNSFEYVLWSLVFGLTSIRFYTHGTISKIYRAFLSIDIINKKWYFFYGVPFLIGNVCFSTWTWCSKLAIIVNWSRMGIHLSYICVNWSQLYLVDAFLKHPGNIGLW
jgi:hypothetical protein